MADKPERTSFKISEWAAMNGMTRQAAYQAIKQGKLFAFRIWEGGEYRIPHEQILQQVREAWAMQNSERRHNR